MQNKGRERGEKKREREREREKEETREREFPASIARGRRMLRAQSRPGHQLLFAVAGESREKAENGKLFKRATTQ